MNAEVIVVLALLLVSLRVGWTMFKDVFGKDEGPRAGGDYG